jgi:hypothetical protein
MLLIIPNNSNLHFNRTISLLTQYHHLSKGLCCQLLLLPGKAVISAAAEGQSEAKNRRNDSPFLKQQVIK